MSADAGHRGRLAAPFVTLRRYQRL